MSVSIQIKPSARLSRQFRRYQSVWPVAQRAIRDETLRLEQVVKSNFLRVQDGRAVAPGRVGRSTRRTRGPGLRYATGNLFRQVRAAFRSRMGGFEGAVGTNVHYGAIHEKKEKYAFLRPALNRERRNIRANFNRVIRRFLSI